MARMIKIVAGWFILMMIGTVQSPLIAKKKPPPPPDFLDEAFSSAEVNELVVLPVADVRIDKSVEFKKLDKIGHKTVEWMLKTSPYRVVYRIDRALVEQMTAEDLEHRDQSWVESLGPENDRWILLLVLQDAAKDTGVLGSGVAFGAVCSGYFFDKFTGKVLWHHETVGTMSAGVAMGAKVRANALQSCIGDLMLTFPDQNTKKK